MRQILVCLGRRIEHGHVGQQKAWSILGEVMSIYVTYGLLYSSPMPHMHKHSLDLRRDRKRSLSLASVETHIRV